MPRGQPASDVVSKDRGERCARGARNVRFFERLEICAAALESTHAFRKRRQQPVGQSQDFCVGRIGAEKQHRLMQTNQRGSIWKLSAIERLEQSGSAGLATCTELPLSGF